MNGGPSDGMFPIKIDPNVRFTSIGGLKEHKNSLREMIIFPLMYPELFRKFDTKPAKGILFHGPPGTGKTLLARALANECGVVGGKPVSFFFRKGADVTNKYWGESERILRTLFQTARKMKPSIIFFDEIDALAPMRGSHDVLNASLVATLLAEMDGVADRGDVIVIGATNRPEAMDPAVRRAGRLDRELYFPAPSLEDRREILNIFTQDWDPSLGNDALDHLAKLTVGFLGSDLKCLCSEAVLKAVRRVYPQIYESNCKLLINAQNVEVTADDMVEAMNSVLPSGSRYTPQAAQPLPLHTTSLLADQLKQATELMEKIFPLRKDINRRCKTGDAGSVAAPSVFLVSGECAMSILGPALLAQLEDCLVKELNVSTLLDSRTACPQHAVMSSIFAECRGSGRDCVIFIRDLQAVWNVLARNCGVDLLLQLWNTGLAKDRTLILAATNCDYNDIPNAIKQLFPTYKNCIYRMREPTESEVADFLRPVVTELPMVPPEKYQCVPPPPLPKAPVGPIKNEKEEIDRIYREYDALRQLRSALKNVARSLSYERRFQAYAEPADEELLPDYYSVVQHPMDLAKVLNKIDNKQYYCAMEFLDDIDLICTNALLYDKHKPSKNHRTFRQDAFALHSEAYSITMDEVSASLELECQIIARRRRSTGDDDPEPDLGGWDENFYLSRLAGIGNVDDIINEQKKPYNDKHSHKRSHDRKDMGPSAKRSRINLNIDLKPNLTIKDHDHIKPHHSKYVEDGIVVTVGNIAPNDDGGVPTGNEKDDTDKSKGKVIAGNETTSEQVLINARQLEDILNSNVGPLRSVGLEALVDLHAQLNRTVYGYSRVYDRRNLPRDLNEIITSYIQHARR